MTVYQQIIKQCCGPLEPRGTGVDPHLSILPGLRAVVFDIYGTLLISACGDIGIASDGETVPSLAAALAAVQLPPSSAQAGVDALLQTISQHHEKARQQGIDYPEVDMVEVWREVLRGLGLQGPDGEEKQPVDIKRLAIEYEVRVNPTWPMPNVETTLTALRHQGLNLGLISNAQFFTIELFPALWGRSAEEMGIDPELQFYSYQHAQAKPALTLYELAAQAFASRGIRTDEVMYVGNDMLNDIMPAHQLGFRTGLFAGDARSLRPRPDDTRVQGIEPDVVLTDLSQLHEVIISDQES